MAESAGAGVIPTTPVRFCVADKITARAAGDSLDPVLASDSLGSTVVKDSTQTDGAPADSARVELLPDRVALYYFHPTIRCQSCLSVEGLAAEVVHAGFRAPLHSGMLEWRIFDFEDPENRDLVEHLQVDESRLLIGAVARGVLGEWRPLDDVWALLEDSTAFNAYLHKELRKALGAE
jgi:hypothetical protein